ncbi:MAG TPA: hypothetical protein VFS97_11365 [Nitrososphaeraceae archaeon]|nr:hypothetical protein [Nitrososphaeraceae archaeon]
MNNNTILAIALLIPGTLLTTVVTTIVPAAYADNENEAEDESAAAIADCDHKDVERAGFDCFGIAVNDIEVDLGDPVRTLTELGSSPEQEATLAGQP